MIHPALAWRSRAAAALLLAVALGACSAGDDVQQAAAGTAAVDSPAIAAAPLPPLPDSLVLTVYKSPTCGCCSDWVDHMRENGFRIVAVDTADVEPIKRRLGVRQEHFSCHTATIGGYVVEGHVPAADVHRMLTERPEITGIAVPGMPQGSPGMETGYKERYDVIAFSPHGRSSVFARR
jgi:hypothetical protein